MITAIAKKVVACVALTGLTAGGWGCGLAWVDRSAPNPSHHTASANGFDGTATAENPMHDCQPAGGDGGVTVRPCAALCALTVTMGPDISSPIALEFGPPHYPAAPFLYEWLNQPEPYPPRV